VISACSLEPEIVTLLIMSEDVPKTLYDMSTTYNTSFIYDCLEFCEVKKSLTDITEREEKNKQDQEKAKQDRMKSR